MAWRRRIRSVSAAITRIVVGTVVLVLLLILAALLVVETGWAKNRIRALLVRQANEYLTATLSIGRLEGSLLGGITLGEVNLARGEKTLIHVDEISFAYSIRELIQRGVVIEEVRLTRPTIVGSKQPDGKWDLGALVKRESREEERTGPSRPIEVQAIQIVDGKISLQDPLDFGAAHVPREFDALNASFHFAYFPVRWTLKFDNVSWTGRAPNLTVTHLAGVLGHGPGGWFFDNFDVETPRSAFRLTGRVNRDRDPTDLDLRVVAPRFAFQEWSGILRGLKDIAVTAAFDTSLKGPVSALGTTLQLTGDGGAVKAQLTLDTTVPGWHAAGAVDLERLNLARWMDRPDRTSDITGHVTLDLALELGRHFPRGVYAFDGPHAMYMNYAGDAVHAQGQITDKAVLVSSASTNAYGAHVTLTDGSIGIDAPFPYRFVGTTTGVDLRQLPRAIPVPHVESVLALDYDVSGRFAEPFIAGKAKFGRSEFLGAVIGPGATGSIDTSQSPVRYAGEGDVTALSIPRFGAGLDVGWMKDPKFASVVAGHFRVQGAGTNAATMTLSGGGRLAHATAFKGTLSNADVSVDINGGTLRASYDGAFTTIDPAVPFDDERFAATLTGSGRMTATAHNLLTQTTTLNDYDIGGSLALTSSTMRSIHIDRGALDATLTNSVLNVTKADLSGPELEGTGHGAVMVGADVTTDFDYDVTRADLARLQALTGLALSGTVTSKGRLTGPTTAMRAAGSGTVTDFEGYDVRAATIEVPSYDATLRGDFATTRAQVELRGSSLVLGDQPVDQITGTATLDARTLGVDLQITARENRSGHITGSAAIQPDARSAIVRDLTLTLGPSPWRLDRQDTPPLVSWTDAGVDITHATFVGERGDERVELSGNWRANGSGTFRVQAAHMSLDSLSGLLEQPSRYGGVMDLDATIRGTRADPRVTATLTVAQGRVERVTYQQLKGSVGYANHSVDVDLRLDQSPGVWVTAAGSIPEAFFTTTEPELPMNVEFHSSEIDLGLLAGLTDVVQDIGGKLNVNVKAVGTSRDPHFDGTVTISDARFRVASTGSPYKNGRANLVLTPERIAVESFHLEDANGRGLDVRGSLATHELRVGDLQIIATARRFEVLRNEFGRVEVDATLTLGGRSESPRISGEISITNGQVKVDEIFQRSVNQPYATEATTAPGADAIAALNPWERLGLDITLKVPNTLRFTDNLQLSQGVPVGLGVDLRVLGDLYLYKDAGQPLYVTGSFDRVVGTSNFQGRRFDVDPGSSINFHGDLDPEIYIIVARQISAVETTIQIVGDVKQPKLNLSSNPPLDESDILSLIVFNRSTNQLSTGQQQELLVRAGALAAGFLATPLLQAIENEIGIDILQIDPSGDFGGGPRVTIGDEIAPGLVARFSRQFGSDPYDEATIEYFLSRVLSIRATFSDAQSLSARSPFRRTERAGIDLLLFFSF